MTPIPEDKKSNLNNLEKLAQRLGNRSQRAKSQIELLTCRMNKNPFRRLSRKGIVVIGSSTGGPSLLHRIIPLIPPNFGVPILLSQHIQDTHTQEFVTSLNHITDIPIEMAKKQDLEPGKIYISPGGKHMRLCAVNRITLEDKDLYDFVYLPSSDLLFQSAARFYGRDCLGVILTGLGDDGTDGASTIKRAGGIVLVQDPKTCTIDGMTKSVIKTGDVDAVLPPEELIARLINHLPET